MSVPFINAIRQCFRNRCDQRPHRTIELTDAQKSEQAKRESDRELRFWEEGRLNTYPVDADEICGNVFSGSDELPEIGKD
jgi:hypothetical protein